MHDKRRILIPVILIVLLLVAGGWYLVTQNQSDETEQGLSGSGTVEAVEVTISPEVSGRAVEVLAQEGQPVEAGQVLFRLDGSLLEAQRAQAETGLAAAQAGVDVASTALDSAQAALESAQIQLEAELTAERAQEQPQRLKSWSADQPADFDLPAWYFTSEEIRAAAIREIQSASEDLEDEKADFNELISNGVYDELLTAEERLAQAQATFLVAQDVLDLAQSQSDTTIRDEAQADYDAAEAEVQAAQEDYDELLSEEEADDLLEARARLALAQERSDTAVDRHAAMLTGEDSLRVQAARAAVKQAETNRAQAGSRLTQAQAAVDQAQAQVDLIDVQMEKLVVTAPGSGVVLSRSIEPGEVVSAGSAAMTLGQLDQLSITVYITEDRYGEIMLGQEAQVRVDSFPNQVFRARVARIADQAEYTPRNVQTDEGQRSTVFAVELAVDDPTGSLKPGMPADVVFEE
jgi:multidrug resistance efflux pump